MYLKFVVKQNLKVVKNVGTQNCGFLKYLVKKLWSSKIVGLQNSGYLKFMFL